MSNSKRKKKVYNPLQCQHRIVAEIKDCYGNYIALLAHHAFKWSIAKKIDGEISITMMPRVKARQEYEKLKKLHTPLGME